MVLAVGKDPSFLREIMQACRLFLLWILGTNLTNWIPEGVGLVRVLGVNSTSEDHEKHFPDLSYKVKDSGDNCASLTAEYGFRLTNVNTWG